MKLATADFTRVSILPRRPAAAVRAGGGGGGGAEHAGCGGRRAHGRRRDRWDPEPSAAGGRARASRAPCRRLPPLHFRSGEAWSGRAGPGETPPRAPERLGGRRCRRSLPDPLRSPPARAELSPPGEPAEPARLLPRLPPPPSHVIIRLHGLEPPLRPELSPSPARPASLARGSRAPRAGGAREPGTVCTWRWGWRRRGLSGYRCSGPSRGPGSLEKPVEKSCRRNAACTSARGNLRAGGGKETGGNLVGRPKSSSGNEEHLVRQTFQSFKKQPPK